MATNEVDPDALLEELMLLDIDKRVQRIAEDVRSGEDRYRPINPHDLAEALGVPQPESPADWSFVCSAEILPLEEYAACWDPVSEFIYRIEGNLDPERFETLSRLFAKLDDESEPSFSFLSAEERAMLEKALALEQLESNRENGMGTLAHYNIKAVDQVLRFEGVIEDDGTCLELLTPYDDREGRFADLTTSVTEEW